MAWEVANEPRPMRAAASEVYRVFLQQTTALIKSIDKHHLVTLGTEGVMGTESAELYETIHRDKNVDYCTIHIWPKNWSWFKDAAIGDSIDAIIKKGNDYIGQHVAIAAAIGKPLVIEEFGLPRDHQSFDISSATSLRDKWFGEVLARWQESVQRNGVLAGVSFWSFGGEVRPVANQVFWKEGDALMGDPPMEEQGLNSVFEGDSSTWTLIDSFIKKTK
jgi:mannan endo-1,4-beta-mannosidase